MIRVLDGADHPPATETRIVRHEPEDPIAEPGATGNLGCARRFREDFRIRWHPARCLSFIVRQDRLMSTYPTKVLFVCAQNKIRSLTAERMFAGSQKYQVRSRGVGNDARVKLTAGDLGWADLIFVMEKNHKNRIMKSFREEAAGKRIICLFIEDIYDPMEESLIAELRRKLAPHLLLPE